MTVSDLIEALTSLRTEYGADVEVVTLDADTGWAMKMKSLPFMLHEDNLICLDGGDYSRDAYYQ